MISRILRNYGMILVLLWLCILFSLLTLKRQAATGEAAAGQLARMIGGAFRKTDTILAVGAENTDSGKVARALGMALQAAGHENVQVIIGAPRDLRLALEAVHRKGGKLDAIAASGNVADWPVIQAIPDRYPDSAGCRILKPDKRLWPDFLKASNLLAIVDRIVVIAVMAIGMTMVIITGGIDLSVGSLIALSAVISTLLMRKMGGAEASAWVIPLGFAAGILACGCIGAVGGCLVAFFKVAPFITTLGFMMIARGLAFMITGGFSIYQVPKGLPWLGQGKSVGIPNTVLLLIVLYLAAHIFMAHTRLGRYIYAIGGNREAARLSGVPVSWVLIFVYMVSALSAGLGGCIQASQLNSGTPKMGDMFELYVIAAVVVGGTSLSGGTGRILGTLIGAFIISVIQNGMNLLGIHSYTQKVVLGTVIVIAVLLDKMRNKAGGLTCDP